jgi:beta-galactosidase
VNEVKTTVKPAKLVASTDRGTIKSYMKDLAFITVKITDKEGLVMPRSNNLIKFSIEGPGEIVATDNGDPTNMVSFSSQKRETLSGLCLAIVRTKSGYPGSIRLTAKSAGLKDTRVYINSK